MSIATTGFGSPYKQLTFGLGINNVYLQYLSQQTIDTSCLSEEYEASRNCIFGEKAFIKDAPVTKLAMILCGYKNYKGYITSNEYFIDKEAYVYKGLTGKLWFIEILSALMARITNYFQALHGYRDEDTEEIKQDIYKLIHEFIYRNIQNNFVPYIDIHFVPDTNKYVVGVSICRA